MRDFWLCFVPLFVAVDAIGVLPMYLSLTEGLDPSRVRRVLLQSVATATAVALAFLGGGKALMTLLGITVADFMIAGGVLLFFQMWRLTPNYMFSEDTRLAQKLRTRTTNTTAEAPTKTALRPARSPTWAIAPLAIQLSNS